MPYKRKDSPYYWIQYTDAQGKRTARSSGTTVYAEAKALEEAHRVDHRRRRGEPPPALFDTVLEAYLAEHGPSAERNHYSARQLARVFAGRTMPEIQGPEILAYVQTRRAEGAGNGTLRRELGLLSAACNFAVRHLGLALVNPVPGRLPSEPPPRARWITRIESARLLNEARRARQSPLLAEFIVIALNTGMRRGELLGLEWARVDMGRACIYLAAEHQKNARAGSVPLNAAARAALVRIGQWTAAHCPGSRWVFSHADGSRIQSIKRAFASACQRAGIVDFHPHDLRHTCAAWLVQSGVPLLEVCHLLRHSDIRMTMRYSHLEPGNIRSAVARLDSDDFDYAGFGDLRIVAK